MSQCRKERASLPISRYLLIFATALILLCFSVRASAQEDPRKPPPPPPHPKLKEVVSKIKNWIPFKKHKDTPATSSPTDNTTASANSDKKPDPVPPPPDPKPQPDVIKPKTTTSTTHKTSVKKKKTVKPAAKTTTVPII